MSYIKFLVFENIVFSPTIEINLSMKTMTDLLHGNVQKIVKQSWNNNWYNIYTLYIWTCNIYMQCFVGLFWKLCRIAVHTLCRSFPFIQLGLGMFFRYEIRTESSLNDRDMLSRINIFCWRRKYYFKKCKINF